jgi:hypothetical protein
MELLELGYYYSISTKTGTKVGTNMALIWLFIYAYSWESTIVTRLLNILCHRAICGKTNLQKDCRKSENDNDEKDPDGQVEDI